MAYISESTQTCHQFSHRNLAQLLFCALQTAKQRRELAKLTIRQLDDIGITIAQRDAELARGFFDF